MKPQTCNSSVPLKPKRALSGWLCRVLALWTACLAFRAPAAVQVVRFDPPLQISAYADPLGDASVKVFGADLDANGEVDFRLGYGLGAMSAYFNAPTRFGQHVLRPNVEGRGGPVAGVPLGSSIGSNIVSSIATNFYAWSSGNSNADDLTAPLGDHEATVVIANVVAFNQSLASVFALSTNGLLLTNIVFPRTVVSGDVAYQDAVMALEFYINGQAHYGYIHFNFNAGAGGVIYGWAYETQPNVAIEAASLAPAPVAPIDQGRQPSGVVGVVEQGTFSGWTVSISTAGGKFVSSVSTDQDGYFKVDLAPGPYVLQPYFVPHPEPGQPLPNFILEGVPKAVKVLRHQFRYVVLQTSPGSVAPSTER